MRERLSGVELSGAERSGLAWSVGQAWSGLGQAQVGPKPVGWEGLGLGPGLGLSLGGRSLVGGVELLANQSEGVAHCI